MRPRRGHSLIVELLGNFLFLDDKFVAPQIVLRFHVIRLRLGKLRLRGVLLLLRGAPIPASAF